ncbi:UNVERIFIED_CONTAM: hypothetical protein FKN15_056988 [Acipenser sinensis]
MSPSPVCRGSCLATRSSATPDIRDWTISRLQLYLRSNNIPFKSTARVQQAPAVTSLATMGVQQAPIVLPSPPTITFQVTSPHCRRPAGPCSDLFGHYGHPAGPQSVQQAPAVTSLATMGVQQAPIVLPSPPTITFQVACSPPPITAGPCSDLAGHYGRPAGPHSAPFSVKWFSTSCELQQGPTAPFYSLPQRSSKCNLLGYPPLTAGIQQAPAATSLAAMGVQHDPIVVSSLRDAFLSAYRQFIQTLSKPFPFL